jgi:hypothetical protein
MTKFDNILLYQIYLITSDIFIRFQNFDTCFRLDISDLGRTYRCIRHIQLPVGFQSLGTSSGSDISIPVAYIRGVRHIRPTVGFQNRDNRFRSDISDSAKIIRVGFEI